MGSPKGGCGPSQTIFPASVILRNQQSDREQQKQGSGSEWTRSSDLSHSRGAACLCLRGARQHFQGAAAGGPWCRVTSLMAASSLTQHSPFSLALVPLSPGTHSSPKSLGRLHRYGMTYSNLSPQEGRLQGSAAGTLSTLLCTHLPSPEAVQTGLISEKSVYPVAQEVFSPVEEKRLRTRSGARETHTHKKASDRW